MTILQIAARLDEYQEDGVIFAELVNGVFTGDSNAVVLTLSEEELVQNTSEVSNNRCPGLEYCLEIGIAKDARNVWSRWREGQGPIATEIAEAICHKANFDAWGPPNS